VVHRVVASSEPVVTVPPRALLAVSCKIPRRVLSLMGVTLVSAGAFAFAPGSANLIRVSALPTDRNGTRQVSLPAARTARAAKP